MSFDARRLVRPLAVLAAVLIAALVVRHLSSSGETAAGHAGRTGDEEAAGAARDPGAASRPGSDDEPSSDPAAAAEAAAGAGDVVGVALDEASVPAAGVTIAVVPAGDRHALVALESGRRGPDDQGLAWTRTGEDGGFRVDDVPAGRVSLVAFGGGVIRRTQPGVDVPAGGEAWVELRLRRGRTISGRIADAAGAPVAGAEVRARGGDVLRAETGTSGDDGTYAVGGLLDGPHSLTVDAAGFLPQFRDGVAAGEMNVDFVMRPGGAIAGRVVWRGTATPIAGATVRAVSLDDGGARSGRIAGLPFGSRAGPPTGEDGAFEIGGLGPGRYVVEADAADRAPGRSAEVTLGPGERLDGVVVELGVGATVSGVVRTRAGRRPVEGATVAIAALADDDAAWSQWIREEDMPLFFEKEAVDGEGSAITDRQGRFALAHVRSGRRTLLARAPGRPGGRTAVDVPVDGELRDVEIVLDEGGAIAGTVRDRDGRPAEGALLTATTEDLTGGSGSGETGADGRYRIDGLRPGRHRVMAIRVSGTPDVLTAGGWTAAEASATVREGETTTLDLRFGGGTRLRGRVRRGGEPVAGAAVIFLGADAHRRMPGGMASTDEEGSYVVDAIAPGSWVAMVSGTTVEVTVPDVAEHRADIDLPTGTVRGRVVDGRSGEPVAGAMILVRRAGGGGGGADAWREMLREHAGGGMSGADGAFEVSGVADGAYGVTASQADHAPGTAAVVVAGGTATGPVVVRLGASVRVSGRVVDGEGRPVAGAFIDVQLPEGGMASPGRFVERMTTADGTYGFGGLGPGTYRMGAVARDLAPSAPRAIEVTASGATADFRLTPGGRLEVRVEDALGRPAIGVEVTLVDASGHAVSAGASPLPLFGADARTDDRGEVVFPRLAPGVYAAGVAGGEPVPVAVEEGGTTSVVLRVRQGP